MIRWQKRIAPFSLAAAAFLALSPLASRGELVPRSQNGRALLGLPASGIEAVGVPSHPSGAERVRRAEGTRANDSAAFERHWAKPAVLLDLDAARGVASSIADSNRSAGPSSDVGPRVARAPPELAA